MYHFHPQYHIIELYHFDMYHFDLYHLEMYRLEFYHFDMYHFELHHLSFSLIAFGHVSFWIMSTIGHVSFWHVIDLLAYLTFTCFSYIWWWSYQYWLVNIYIYILEVVDDFWMDIYYVWWFYFTNQDGCCQIQLNFFMNDMT